MRASKSSVYSLLKNSLNEHLHGARGSLGFVLVITTVLVIMAGMVTYLLVSDYVLREAEANIRDIMLSHRGLHQYIQKVMHPTFYAARDAGEVKDDFYAPQIFSSSYIVRVMHALTIEERKKKGLPEIYYKMASTNPRNPVNRADDREARLITLFNEQRDRKEYREVVTVDGKKFLHYAVPFLETGQGCLRCHGKRKDAPAGLQKMYPGEGGFNEKAGVFRAIESLRVPLDHQMTITYILTAAASTGMIVPLAMLGFNSRLRTLVRMKTSALEEEIDERQQIQDSLHEQTLELESEIAERQMAQESLLENESLLRIVADYASNWEYWRLPDGSFQYISPSVRTITGYAVEEFMNNAELLNSIIHPDDRELFLDHTHKIDQDGQIVPMEMRILTREGDIRWMGHVCQQVFTPAGIPWGWRASNQDITARKLMEHELYEQTRQLEEEVAERVVAQEELELLNHYLEERVVEAISDLRRKDQILIHQSRLAAMGEMINNIAHQWRQPLNNIGLIIQNTQLSFDSGAITREEMETEVRKAMDIIMHMSRTIDDFRNFFRNDKEKRAFVINNAVSRVLKLVSASLENRKIRIEIEADHDVTAVGYHNEYSQVLLNIISNVRETCHERGVSDPRLSIRITSENGRSVVSIRDNCGGIPDDILPKIFDPYFTTRGPDKGTGIGLYMSKVIIEQNMDGSLTARNVEGGAEFRIEV